MEMLLPSVIRRSIALMGLVTLAASTLGCPPEGHGHDHGDSDHQHDHDAEREHDGDHEHGDHEH